MEAASGISALIGFLGGLFGVLVGAYLSYRSTLLIERKKQTTDLYMFYSSAEFTVARNETGTLLRVELHNGNDNSWSGLHARFEGSAQWEKISMVDHFFRSLYFLSQDNLIDKKLARVLFQDIHSHWFNRYFSIIDQASKNPTLGTQTKLNNWFNEK